jgi:tetratricopeptide (TPR) repeat protein
LRSPRVTRNRPSPWAISRAARAGLLVWALGLVGCSEARARYHAHLGSKAYHQGRYAQAIAHFDVAVSARPDLSLAWFNLGVAHRALLAPGLGTGENAAHVQGAIAAFQRYLARVPTDREARELLLATYVDAGQADVALAFLEAGLPSASDPLAVTSQLAELATQLQRWDAARLWHQRRAELERTSDGRADAWLAIGSLALRRLSGHPELGAEVRRRIADEGLSAVRQADALRPAHAETGACRSSLERERELVTVPDAGP